MLSTLQGSVLQSWSLALQERGAELRTVPRDEYTSDPFGRLRTELQLVDGAVIFGFRHMQGLHGTCCAGTSEERAAPDALASPWTQIEAGIAIAAGLPVLALAEQGIAEGVFDPTTWGHQVIGNDLTQNPDPVPLDRFLATVEAHSR
jgi:hypothetical protein